MCGTVHVDAASPSNVRLCSVVRFGKPHLTDSFSVKEKESCC
jgi:hypothetical protein